MGGNEIKSSVAVVLLLLLCDVFVGEEGKAGIAKKREVNLSSSYPVNL